MDDFLPAPTAKVVSSPGVAKAKLTKPEVPKAFQKKTSANLATPIESKAEPTVLPPIEPIQEYAPTFASPPPIPKWIKIKCTPKLYAFLKEQGEKFDREPAEQAREIILAVMLQSQ